MSRDEYDPRMQTLERGLNGCHGEATSSWASGACHLSMCDDRLSAYYGDVAPGGYVIDKTDLLEYRPEFALASPMCRVGVEPGTVDRLADRIGPDHWLVDMFTEAVGDEFQGLATLAKTQLTTDLPEPGPRDFISPEDYARWWADRGARVGQRVDDEIVWADGNREAIRPVEYRYQLETGDRVEG